MVKVQGPVVVIEAIWKWQSILQKQQMKVKTKVSQRTGRAISVPLGSLQMVHLLFECLVTFHAEYQV